MFHLGGLSGFWDWHLFLMDEKMEPWRPNLHLMEKREQQKPNLKV